MLKLSLCLSRKQSFPAIAYMQRCLPFALSVVLSPTVRGISSAEMDVTVSRKSTQDVTQIETSKPLTQPVSLLLQNPNNSCTTLMARPGQNLLEVLRNNYLDVEGTCGGELTCSTCHCVIEKKFYKILPEKSLEEEDILYSVKDAAPTSRLSCQVVVDERMDGMRVSLPGMLDAQYSPEAKGPRKAVKPVPKIRPLKYKQHTKSAIPAILNKYASCNPNLAKQSDAIITLASVMPFRTNNYVIDELIDWSNVPDDPIFQLNFPQPGMLPPSPQISEVARILQAGGPAAALRRAADVLRTSLNPHPAMQQQMNVPRASCDQSSQPEFTKGIQHKYRETVLFFPSDAQYCHSYCTYCFRWAQFVGSTDMQFASSNINVLMDYLRRNPNVTDLLVTGGDPMVLNSRQLGRYLDAVSGDATLEHVQTIRLGSKSLAYWPYKYVTDDDADMMLRLFERTVKSGKHVSFMAHFTHPVELSTPVVQEAIRRIRDTGVQIRCQAPLTNHINNDPDTWTKMWREQVRLGLIPYYMFMERDTGARDWFGVSIARALDVYNQSIRRLSGLAKTVRGPCMSCTPGKVHVLGVESIAGERVFVLKFLQARNPNWNDRVFFAKFDENARWLDELVPAFNEDSFFFQEELDSMKKTSMTGKGVSGQMFQY